MDIHGIHPWISMDSTGVHGYPWNPSMDIHGYQRMDIHGFHGRPCIWQRPINSIWAVSPEKYSKLEPMNPMDFGFGKNWIARVHFFAWISKLDLNRPVYKNKETRSNLEMLPPGLGSSWPEKMPQIWIWLAGCIFPDWPGSWPGSFQNKSNWFCFGTVCLFVGSMDLANPRAHTFTTELMDAAIYYIL